MTTLRSTICMFLAAATAFGAGVAFQGNELKSRFEELDGKGDKAGIVNLWKEHPHEALSVIDEYLEGALAKIEKGAAPAEEIAKMHERAVRGALLIDEALGRPIFSDYASSYAGFTPEQQKQFRNGQKASGAARQAMKKKDYKTAKDESQKCIDFARPLGDWWGAASGYAGLADAQEALGEKDAALDSAQMARLLHNNLGFASNEYHDLGVMARMLVELGRKDRATVVIDQGLALAKVAGDKTGGKAFEELKKKLK
ncbi:MAG: hypothetical protein HY286_09800 [Planctomycetes bacterium]|nr:hypothetical protein [Planctomycetota bacterium]